jgi:hypothetical protein
MKKVLILGLVLFIFSCKKDIKTIEGFWKIEEFKTDYSNGWQVFETYTVIEVTPNKIGVPYNSSYELTKSFIVLENDCISYELKGNSMIWSFSDKSYLKLQKE